MAIVLNVSTRAMCASGGQRQVVNWRGGWWSISERSYALLPQIVQKCSQMHIYRTMAAWSFPLRKLAHYLAALICVCLCIQIDRGRVFYSRGLFGPI